MPEKKGGAGYQIKCVKDVINAKEKKGQDASFERKLLEAWAKHPGCKLPCAKSAGR